MVITIAGVVLASSARRSCRESLQSADESRQLQIRWGRISCSAAILPKAEQILQGRSAELESPVRQTESVIVLGDIKFRLIVSDEQAKANVNLLANLQGQKGLREILRKLQADLSSQAVLLPLSDDSTNSKISTTSFSCFAQIFSNSYPGELLSTKNENTLIDRITCWSDGRLNFRRAEKIVLQEMLRNVLSSSQIGELLQLCQDTPDITLYEAAEQLDLPKAKVRQLRSLLTDTSNCHGLWIIAQGQTRNWYSFSVKSGGIGFLSLQGGHNFTW